MRSELRVKLHPDSKDASNANYRGPDFRIKTHTKQHWGDIYFAPTPVPFFTAFTPYDYGHYHDRFLEIFSAYLHNHHPDRTECLKFVEIGASYGNTTLAYKCGYDWSTTGQIWSDDTVPLLPMRNVHVTAVDMSAPALRYGQARGIFDDVMVHDFNAHLPEILTAILHDADALVLIMVSSYFEALPFQRLCLNFLGDREKQKTIAYNVSCAFNSQNLSPEHLFAGIKNWTTSTHFTKHRDFTESESALHHGCKESWSYTYLVNFDAVEVGDAATR
ncbi:MAG: hypothetical protein ACR2JI_16640 [Mycobacterium sp.]